MGIQIRFVDHTGQISIEVRSDLLLRQFDFYQDSSSLSVSSGSIEVSINYIIIMVQKNHRSIPQMAKDHNSTYFKDGESPFHVSYVTRFPIPEHRRIPRSLDIVADLTFCLCFHAKS